MQTRPEASRPDATTEAPPFVEQLELRLNELRPAPEGRRNPFVFATREREAAPAGEPPPLPLEAREPAPVVSGPAYVLAGIGITGEARTAVLASGDAVHIVKVNDVVDGFTVAEISDAAVTLVRGAERHVLRFAQ